MVTRVLPASGPIRLVNKVGSLTAPVSTLGAIAASTFFPNNDGQVIIPGSTLYAGWTGVLTMLADRTGSTATISNVLLKWGTSPGTGNTTIINQNVATTSNNGVRYIIDLFYDGTRMVATGNLGVTASGSPAFFELAVSSAQSLYIEAGASSITSPDTLRLLMLTLDRKS
jgi:hypothetical protein